jgi:hypothetical protein
MDPTYAAGFFDGEGCISVSRYVPPNWDRPVYLLEASVTHTYRPVVEMLAMHWGGNISPYKRRMPHHKDRWHWKLHGDGLVRFLQDIQPFLIEKAPQVEMALQFTAEKTHGRNRLTVEQLALREGYYLALREAKR